MLPLVLATPVMIMAMEAAALNAIKAYLDPGESAVGTAIDIRHLAATPVGGRVTAAAEVTKVSGLYIEFTIQATEGTKEIGVGAHATRPNSRSASGNSPDRRGLDTSFDRSHSVPAGQLRTPAAGRLDDIGDPSAISGMKRIKPGGRERRCFWRPLKTW
jgi:hypothetical protein